MLPQIDSTYLQSVLLELLAVSSPVGDTENGIEKCRQIVCKFDGLDVRVTRKGAFVATWNGEKSDVQQAVKTRLKLASAPHPPDVADALAIALCFAARQNRDSVLA